MCGGSAPSGETKYQWNDDMKDRWNNTLNRAEWQSETPFEYYNGDRYSDMNIDQNQAHNYTRAMATGNSNPLGAMNGARQGIEDTLGGKYLSGPDANPGTDRAANPFGGNYHNSTIGNMTGTERNTFAGNNPYFRDTMLGGMKDITDAYQQGTAADTTRLFNQAGAFGGSAHVNKIANNEAALGKNLTSYTDSMLNQQFNRSAGLEDSFLGRDIQNQQFNKGIAGQYDESRIGRGYQDYASQQDQGYNAFENERNRMMGAIGAGQAEQGLAYQRIGALDDQGKFIQQNSQKDADFNYQQWTQKQNHPFAMLDWLTGKYGTAQGGMAPNSQIYQSGQSQAAPWLGAAMMGASML